MKLGPLIIGLLLILGGATLGFYAGRGVYRAWSSRTWPVATGHVISSRIETIRARRGATFRPEVDYEYSVGSQNYTSHQIAFGSVGTSDPGEAQSLVRRYARGAEVRPRYSPEDPSVACLECGRVTPADYAITLVGVGLAVFGALALRQEIASRLRRQSAPGRARHASQA